jgi:hypothetical protein
MLLEYSSSGKWLELLKQIGAIQAAAQSVGVEVSPVSVQVPGEIERAVVALARSKMVA